MNIYQNMLYLNIESGKIIMSLSNISKTWLNDLMKASLVNLHK